MDKWNYIKLKSCFTTKEMVSKLKRPHTEWEKIFASYATDKGVILRLYREFKKPNYQKINDPMNMWANELNTVFSNEEVQVAKDT
jgi:hypothetical protein